MIKLGNLERWSPLSPKETLVLDGGPRPRKVRLHVNAPGIARFYLVEGKRSTFLAATDGCDVVEFVGSGSFEIATRDEDVAIWTSELEPTHRRVIDPVVFTKIAQRRSRNPELEQMMFAMNANIEKRLARQAAEHSAQLGALAAAVKGSKRTDRTEGEGGDDLKGPATGTGAEHVAGPDADGGAPREDASTSPSPETS